MSNTSQPTASELDALKQHDQQAFTKLVLDQSERIYRLSLKMLGNAQDAEDVLQETFIKAFNNIKSFEGRSQVSTWLYRIAINESLMLLRKRKGNLTSIDEGIETEDGNVMPKQIVDWCCLPEKELMSTETQQIINQAIDALNETHRAAFLLRDVEGLSTREAAEVLEISESALKVRLFRARMALREELSHYFADKMSRSSQ